MLNSIYLIKKVDLNTFYTYKKLKNRDTNKYVGKRANERLKISVSPKTFPFLI